MEIKKIKENEFKENFKRAKNLYNALKKDGESVSFASEKINKQLIKKIERSKFEKDIIFLKLYNNIKNVNLDEKEEIPTFVPFIENKKDIDNSTLYSFNGPFQLLHADIADIRFFSKSAVDPHCCLLFVDLFTQNIYTFPMKKRNLLKKKMQIFYEEIQHKRKERMRLQTDLEFQQNEIKNLNKKYNVEMFSTRVRGGKAFAAEQKIREFKKPLLKIKVLYKKNKIKFKPNEIVKKATTNMNKTKSTKYQIEPEYVERKSLEDDNFRQKFDFIGLERLVKIMKELKDIRSKKIQPLMIGEKVLSLSERIKKKDAPGKLYKSTTQNQSFFNKDKIFIVKKRVKTISNDWYYWVAEEKSDKINKFKFVRQELYALDGQWM